MRSAWARALRYQAWSASNLVVHFAEFQQFEMIRLTMIVHCEYYFRRLFPQDRLLLDPPPAREGLKFRAYRSGGRLVEAAEIVTEEAPKRAGMTGSR